MGQRIVTSHGPAVRAATLATGVLVIAGICDPAAWPARKAQASVPATVARSGSADSDIVTPIPFGEKNGDVAYNASAAVPVGDSRFLLVDNKTDDALFELSLTPEGAQASRLIRRPLVGLAPGSVDDMEAMTLVEEKGRRFIFVATSLNAKQDATSGTTTAAPGGLLRVTEGAEGKLETELIPDFREWLVKHQPELRAVAGLEPDAGGLNVEGLAWDPTRRALLLGLRTPVLRGKPFIVPVRIKNLGGPWTTSNLELLPSVRLLTERSGDEQGVRSIEFDPLRKAFLVIVGRARSKTKAPFQVYVWDGNGLGRVRRLRRISFAPEAKPEGITTGTVAGRRVVLIADDEGGFAVLRDGDARLK